MVFQPEARERPLNRKGSEPKLLATSDIHSPVYLQLFRKALHNLKQNEKWCAIILAGDLVDKGRAEMFDPIVRFIRETLGETRIIAVFGNEEYEEIKERLRKSYNKIIWLDDEYTIINCDNTSIGVVGTQGALDRLTSWQRRNKPFLRKIYDERPIKIKKLILDLKDKVDYIVLVSHYVVSKRNLVGENPKMWPEMYSSKMERVVVETKPNVAIHGHAHNGSKFSMINGVPVYNVALPLNKKIVEIKFRHGLEAFF